MGKQKRQILIHVFGCVLFLLLPIIFSPDLSSSFYFLKIPFFQKDFVNYVMLILCFYFNYYFLIPNFYFKRKYFLFIGGAMASFMCLIFLPHLLVMNFSPTINEPFISKFPFSSMPKEIFFLREFSYDLFPFVAVFAFSFMLKIYSRWQQAEKEKANTEVSYLKSQINPHFLFNTLNSIYSLAIEKSDNTAPAVVKLSGMMRYVLSETDKDFVPLEKEISYINDYIDLQKIRFGDTAKITYFTQIDSAGKKIAPLLLIPFIENAFKYGVNAEENSDVYVKIAVKSNELILEVYNNKVIVNSTTTKSGLGIENTKKRLDILYPGKHRLIISDNKVQFSVVLSITLQ